MRDPLGLRRALDEYASRHPDEAAVADRFRALLSEGARAFTRGREAGHLTASAWVLDGSREHVLLVHHRKLGKWLQPGGHADGNTDLPAVARTEVLEETGVEADGPHLGQILDIDIHPIPTLGTVPAHEHFDIRFLLTAVGTPAPQRNHESHDARWVASDRIEELTTEASILRMREKAARLRMQSG